MLPQRVLVANRGEIARRIFRTCQRLGITAVAVFSDADAGEPHTAEADLGVRLPGVSPADTYLRADLLIDAAVRSGAGAVHPGYGFLSEDAEFARAVMAAGLTWVGPSPEAIQAMGSKLAAKARMAAAGVPVLPGGDVTGLDEEAIGALADTTGYPLLVKASAGGGGRGMRLVEEPSALAVAVESAAREATSAFGDGTVFLERFAATPRHVEVQVIADQHGTVVHLFERECSIQRRHQKILEEAPSPAVDDELRARLGDAAISAAKAVGYVGAGTVEFVLDAAGQFAFLEMNTRLQVEHPVTEAITGLDLVELQLRIACGEPLPSDVHTAVIGGHAIEARLYAEDPVDSYRPAAGTVTRFTVPALEGVRVDSGIESGSVVGTHYDPLLAKLIAWAPTRAEAIQRLSAALARAQIHGVTTNRDLLVAVLEHDEHLAGRIDTGFLDRHPPAELTATGRTERATRLHAAAAALALQASRRASTPVLRLAPSGWRNNPSQPQRERLSLGDREVEVDYELTRSSATVSVDGTPIDEFVLLAARADVVDVEVRGVRHRFDVHLQDNRIDVDSVLGSTTFSVIPRFAEPGHDLAAGSLVAPMPGSVVRVEVEPGDEVEAGALLVVLEAMKMEHPVTAPAAGKVIEVDVTAGDQVDSGQVLVVIEPADLS